MRLALPEGVATKAYGLAADAAVEDGAVVKRLD
jgi:hypothetical protein